MTPPATTANLYQQLPKHYAQLGVLDHYFGGRHRPYPLYMPQSYRPKPYQRANGSHSRCPPTTPI
eukprot:scaffold3777_cov123-Isochrysis_galbana.AAC.4